MKRNKSIFLVWVAAISLLGIALTCSSCSSDPLTDLTPPTSINDNEDSEEMEEEKEQFASGVYDLTLIDYDGVGYLFQIEKTNDIIFISNREFKKQFGDFDPKASGLKRSVNSEDIPVEIPESTFYSQYLTFIGVIVYGGSTKVIESPTGSRWITSTAGNTWIDFSHISNIYITNIVGNQVQNGYTDELTGSPDFWNSIDIVYYGYADTIKMGELESWY